ncbi:MAG: paraquat-inducible protein A [Saprospiraceae bacterium]|nr:paraquat-inducible protein A [Saprospiraceae bacterium]
MKGKILLAFVVLSLLGSAFLSWRIYWGQRELDRHALAFAELNKINYGLFNMQAWKLKAFEIFSGHITEFNISPSAYQEAEAELRKYLYSIYEEHIATGKLFARVFEDAEKNSKVNKMLLKLFKDNLQTQLQELNIKGHIPEMAVQLAAELKNNEPRFRQIMQNELVRLMQYKDKYVYVDPRLDQFKALGCEDLDCAKAKLNNSIDEKRAETNKHATWLMAILLLAFVLLAIGYKSIGLRSTIGLLTLFSVLLLLLGISLPMIVIDARLNSFVFNLYEQDVSFGEQVVFYQSKSILDVTRTLIESRGFDLKIVGFLILCFSVIFPFIKLVLSGLFLQYQLLRNSAVVRNMIFYLGKWSMADVFVVALFMAYIGFYGLFDAQLSSLEQNKGGFAVETVNYTHLAPGALFFTTYCILSIVLGIIINKWHLAANSMAEKLVI